MFWFVISQAPPVLIHGDGGPGSIYVGEVPPNWQGKPVIVFVHGKSSSKDVWLVDNDIYQRAYNAGYRTAFVNLEPEATMWKNGQLLHNLLKIIGNYYATTNILVIAHSKGGIDTETAIYHYGNRNVKNIITLGTPYWGSPLADLAFSVWFWWLAEILGLATDAAYVLQTSYMAWFRSITDPMFSAYSMDVYAYASWFDGTPFTWPWNDNFCLSAICWGQAYLSLNGGSCSEGGNDGAVTYSSASKPTSWNMSPPCDDPTWKYNHYEITKGWNVWNKIKLPFYKYAVAKGTSSSPFLEARSSLYITNQSERIYVEEGTSMLLLYEGSSPPVYMDGRKVEKLATLENVFFPGLKADVYRFDEEGFRTFNFDTKRPFVAMVFFPNREPSVMSLPKLVYTRGEEVEIYVKVPNDEDYVVRAWIVHEKTGKKYEMELVKVKPGIYKGIFTQTYDEEVYNVSVNVVEKEGTYKVSLVKTFMVVQRDGEEDMTFSTRTVSNYVSLKEGASFEIYTIDGKLVRKGYTKDGRVSLKALPKGIYILKTKGETYRILRK